MLWVVNVLLGAGKNETARVSLGELSGKCKGENDKY